MLSSNLTWQPQPRQTRQRSTSPPSTPSSACRRSSGSPPAVDLQPPAKKPKRNNGIYGQTDEEVWEQTDAKIIGMFLYFITD